MTGQPQQHVKDGAIVGCGMRVVGVFEPPAGVPDASTLDASINLNQPGFGLLKAIGGTINMPALMAYSRDPSRGLPPERRWRPEAFWFKASGAPATRPQTPLTGADPPEAALYATNEIEPILAVLSAILEAKQIQIGVRQPGRNFEQIYQVKVRLKDGERETLSDCLRELIANGKK